MEFELLPILIIYPKIYQIPSVKVRTTQKSFDVRPNNLPNFAHKPTTVANQNLEFIGKSYVSPIFKLSLAHIKIFFGGGVLTPP